MRQVQLLLIFLLTLFTSACAFAPGAQLSTINKTVVDTGKVDINELVDIYPITPQLIYELQAEPITSRLNPKLESELEQYEYRIGVGDVLNVTVWDHPELTIPAGSYRSASEAGNWVHADGTIFYPYAGHIDVLGKTVVEVRDDISKRLSRYIENPQVDVNLAAFRSQRVYVAGEIKTPGTLSITNVPLTLVDAFNLAGGLTDQADWQRVVLTRNGIEYPFSLKNLLKYGDLSMNQILEHGDMLYVPRNDAQKVFVMGEVSKGDTLSINREGMTLAEALSSSAGLNQNTANATGVFVIRKPVNGESKGALYQLDMKDATALIMAAQFELEAFDIVYVTSTSLSRWNRLIGQIVPTLTGLYHFSLSLDRLEVL